jgi:hypothetical protein
MQIPCELGIASVAQQDKNQEEGMSPKDFHNN